MPNYCNNTLTIKSDNAGFLQDLMNEMKMEQHDSPRFLEKLVPFTADINYEWDYDWCVENWGTKWDIFDLTYASLDGDTLDVVEDEAAQVCVRLQPSLALLGVQLQLVDGVLVNLDGPVHVVLQQEGARQQVVRLQVVASHALAQLVQRADEFVEGRLDTTLAELEKQTADVSE